MTLERQKYLEPFIIAQNQGRIIEIKLGKHLSWQETKTPVISVGEDADYIEYRIKPEPREWYEIIHKQGETRVLDQPPFSTYEAAKDANKTLVRFNDYEIIKVREVLD